MDGADGTQNNTVPAPGWSDNPDPGGTGSGVEPHVRVSTRRARLPAERHVVLAGGQEQEDVQPDELGRQRHQPDERPDPAGRVGRELRGSPDGRRRGRGRQRRDRRVRRRGGLLRAGAGRRRRRSVERGQRRPGGAVILLLQSERRRRGRRRRRRWRGAGAGSLQGHGGGGGGSFVDALGATTLQWSTTCNPGPCTNTELTSIDNTNLPAFAPPWGNDATAPDAQHLGGVHPLDQRRRLRRRRHRDRTGGAGGGTGSNGFVLLVWYFDRLASVSGLPAVQGSCSPAQGTFIEGAPPLGPVPATTTYFESLGPTTFTLTGGSGGEPLAVPITSLEGGSETIEVTVNVTSGQHLSYIEGCAADLSIGGPGFQNGGSSGTLLITYPLSTGPWTDVAGEAGGGGGVTRCAPAIVAFPAHRCARPRPSRRRATACSPSPGAGAGRRRVLVELGGSRVCGVVASRGAGGGSGLTGVANNGTVALGSNASDGAFGGATGADGSHVVPATSRWKRWLRGQRQRRHPLRRGRGRGGVPARERRHDRERFAGGGGSSSWTRP